MDNKPAVFIPSFDFDRKTKALNRFMLPLVSGISMFTVSIFVGGFIYAFLSSFLKLPVQHLEIFFYVPFAVFLLSSWQLVPFLLTLLTSYKIEDNKITRGVINGYVRTDSDGRLYVVPGVAVGRRSLSSVISLIRTNMQPGFAEESFDTEAYKKTEYLNPVLIRETDRLLVYLCDGNKKIRIPKVYDGMCETYRSEGRSFAGRIATVSAVVLALSLIFAAADLSIGKYKTDTEYEPAINASKEVMLDVLEDFGYAGYELPNNSIVISDFTKEVGDRESRVYYTFDEKGNIVSVYVQLYFLPESENVEAELRTIIGTMDTNFSESDIDGLIAAVQSNLDGEYQYYRMKSDKYTLTVGISGDYVDVH